MPRIIGFALASAVLALPCTAAAQTTDAPGATATAASCAEPTDAAAATPTQLGGDSPSTPSGGGSGGGSGGIGPSTSTSTSASATTTSSSGGAGAPPLAQAAQEPVPEPEGPGEEQPDEPGGEPQTPTGDEGAGDEGGGLPRTGLAVLQLALLGVVLVLVGARIRVLVKKRRGGGGADGPAGEARLQADGLPSEPTVAAFREEPDSDLERAETEEWSFPDPDEEAPTGLLPSTASARRQAR